jgi:MFS family permease
VAPNLLQQSFSCEQPYGVARRHQLPVETWLRSAMTTTTEKRTPIALVAPLINYVDRGSIGIAAPLIQTEFNLSASQMGWVLAAFFWAYAPMQPLMGWLANRIGAERVLVTGFCVWSIATVLTGLATGFAMLFAFRLLMGTGESVAYPSAAKLLATHVEPRHRARSMGSAVLGAIVGLTVGAFLGGWLLGHYGWRAMLITLGGASLLWLIPWFGLWGRRTTSSPAVAQAGPTTIYLVQDRGMLLTTMTQVAGSTFIADGSVCCSVPGSSTRGSRGAAARTWRTRPCSQ